MSAVAPTPEELDRVRWHDLECGSYRVDEALWRDLAGDGPVLDVGAGTGRVALDLAARGLDVTAVDLDPALLAELDRRAEAAGLSGRIRTVAADARELELGERFAAVLVPMQTIQLLEGPAGRAPFLARARAHLGPGGILAAALADAMEGYDATTAIPPLPDMGEFDGRVYASRPIAVVDEGRALAIHRLREVVAPDGSRATTEDVVRLDHLPPGTLAEEAAAAGLAVREGRRVPATDEYVGSTVVVLEAADGP